MMLFTVSLAVFSASLVFSMMGAGGSQILVPLLYWLGMDFKAAAIPLGLLTSALTCFSAGIVYYRRGLVKVTTVYPFALAVLAGSPLGAFLARSAPSRALMVSFAAVNILVGLLVLRKRGMTREIRRDGEMALALAMGLGIGFMIGFVARDGGAFTVAILVLLGMDVREAAGTAPVIVAAGCLVAFFVRSLDMEIPWSVVIAGAVAALAGSQLGARLMTRRLESRRVAALFSATMVVSGVVIMTQAFLEG